MHRDGSVTIEESFNGEHWRVVAEHPPADTDQDWSDSAGPPIAPI